MAEKQSWEKFAAQKGVSDEMNKKFNEWASGNFVEHSIVYAPYEYFWYDQDGNRFSVVVKDSTQNVRTVDSDEFHKGNVHLWERYRGGVLIATNDPRKRKQVKKDPGPQVWCVFPNGKSEWLKLQDFLGLINKNQAKARSLSVRNIPRSVRG